MAKYERTINAGFHSVLDFCHKAVMDGSMSASYEDGSDFTDGNINVAVRVYERYSYFGKNRVSMSITLVGNERGVFLSAITAGGSQAVVFKINTLGEENFLDTLVHKIEKKFPY